MKFTASVPMSESQAAPSLLLQLCNYEIYREKRNLVTFQDAWRVKISTMTHYDSIHMIINRQWVHVYIDRRTPVETR